MPYDFDYPIDRRASNSMKWRFYGDDVLPLWVADMDFPAPPPILEALRRAIEHGIFGYDLPSLSLRTAVARRMEALYGWQVCPEWVIATPGIVSAFTAAAQAVCQPGQAILVQPPVYPPFLKVGEYTGLPQKLAPLRRVEDGIRLRYEIDWDALETAFRSDPPVGMFLLCSPHNPTGNVFAPEDLQRLAALCQEHRAFLCSDEIHSELLLGQAQHTPLAALLDPQAASCTITLIAPSKTFNIPGLFCGFAIIPDDGVRRRFRYVLEKMTLHVNSLGLVAAEAAFSGACDDWLAELRRYLTANRDFLVETIERDFPGLRTTVPEATYLAWLDGRQLIAEGKIQESPHRFFLTRAKVALNEGADFGPGGEGFVRLNFGCPRSTLQAALERMHMALYG